MTAFKLVRPIGLSMTGGVSVGGDVSASEPSPPPSPSGSVEQFLTSDGGSAAFTESNFSGPTRDRWHNRLGVAWGRTYIDGVDAEYGLGNWLDENGVEEGDAPYGSSAALSAVDQVASVAVTALVAKWLSTGANRGFYLQSRASAWPVAFYGRADAAPENRPKLTVVTAAGTTELTAAANAAWNKTSFTGGASASEWTLVSDAQPGILRFDLSSVAGPITSATLTFKVKAFPGSAGQIIDVFEADPPLLISPDNVASPVLGLASEYADFAALKASADADLIFADDFESPGPFDTGWTPNPTRTLNSATGTTYARGQITSGNFTSADVKVDVSAGTGTDGEPDVVIQELFGQYWLYLENDFGTVADTSIKVPAMGVQFGRWNPVGYWQQTTGNGGTRGTGLKVWNEANEVWEYQGHSVRILTGNAPAAGDDDPYNGFFGMAFYPYNLDQVQDFPAGEAWPRVVIRKERQYCIDIRIKQNSMSGSQDADGNYATAVADGVMQAWINGYLAYSKETFRWRRHAEFGVQGIWMDVYHGGTIEAPTTMHYQLDRVSLASRYIGPPLDLPSWVPDPGEVATLTVANGGLANNWRDALDAYYEPFYGVKAVNDYSGAFKNPYWGDYGCTVFFGGGHAGCNYNGVIVAEYGADEVTFKLACPATPWFGTGTDITTRENNGGAVSTNHLMNLNYMEALVDGKPGSPHSYGCGDIVGPEFGGAANGTFLRVVTAAVNRQNDNGAVAAHQLPFTSTASGDAGDWERVTDEYRTDLNNWLAPQLSEFVGPQQRVYVQTNNGTTNVRWFDRVLRTWVDGTGTTFGYDGADGFNSGILIYVRSRELLLCLYPVSGSLRVQWMDVSVDQPTLGGTATLGTALALDLPWSAATWVTHSNRIVLIGVTGDNEAAYEIAIPATLTDPWPVERAPFGTGQTLAPADPSAASGLTYKKFGYEERIRSITYFPLASVSGADQMRVYRPRNT